MTTRFTHLLLRSPFGFLTSFKVGWQEKGDVTRFSATISLKGDDSLFASNVIKPHATVLMKKIII